MAFGRSLEKWLDEALVLDATTVWPCQKHESVVHRVIDRIPSLKQAPSRLFLVCCCAHYRTTPTTCTIYSMLNVELHGLLLATYSLLPPWLLWRVGCPMHFAMTSTGGADA